MDNLVEEMTPMEKGLNPEKLEAEEKFMEKDVPEVNELGYPARIVDQAKYRSKALDLFQKR